MWQYTKKCVNDLLKSSLNWDIPESDLVFTETRREFEGDITLVCFSLSKYSHKNPHETANILGGELVAAQNEIMQYNVVKGFLNLSLSNQFWQNYIFQISNTEDLGKGMAKDRLHVIEYCSPNTNKPLHLGHIRNILLGDAIANIKSHAGYDVKRVQIINDRGIAICKSMLAWKKFGQNQSPESIGVKPDHFVGSFYVLFETKFQEEYKAFQNGAQGEACYQDGAKKDESRRDFFSRFKHEYFNKYSTLGSEAKELLTSWEEGDEDVLSLWKRMNQWVYKGFETTYQSLNVHFDRLYYESQTYLLGKSIVKEGLEKGLFYRKEDGSVWVDLTSQGLDHKLLLRSDGTSVYITQDIGTAEQRYTDYTMDAMTYVVGDEQIYHFDVLFKVLQLMDRPYADHLFNLAYGMVDLPDGKMKSREGNVVDADELIKDVVAQAHEGIRSRESVANISTKEISEISEKVGLSALKYFILKVNPKKRMTFNPAEAIDMQGQTGPYIQYSFVRINGLLNRAKQDKLSGINALHQTELSDIERMIAIHLSSLDDVIAHSAEDHDPSLIANYAYQLAKLYHKFWSEIAIFGSDEAERNARLLLSDCVGRVLKLTMNLLGIQMPQKM